MPLSGTLTKARIVDAVAEKIGFTSRKSIEAGRNIAGTYQIRPGILGVLFGKTFFPKVSVQL